MRLQIKQDLFAQDFLGVWSEVVGIEKVYKCVYSTISLFGVVGW